MYPSSAAGSGFSTQRTADPVMPASRFHLRHGFNGKGLPERRDREGTSRALPDQLRSAGSVRSEVEREDNFKRQQPGSVEATPAVLPRQPTSRSEARGPGRVLKPGNKVGSKESISSKGDPIPRDINEALVKTEHDKLFFSKKSRKVEFQPCTTKQYLKTKPKTYYELGKLQADLNRSDLVERRERRNKAITFAKKYRKQNAEYQANLKKRTMERKPFFGCTSNNARELLLKKSARPKALSARERALQFAKTIPKPRVKSASPRNITTKQGKKSIPTAPEMEKKVYDDSIHASAELEELERRHDTQLMQIEQIKREFQRE